MRAVRRSSPNVIEVVDVSEPVAGPDEVVVDVAFAGVNPFDMQVLSGQIGGDRPLTLGAEATGRLEGVPVQVSGGGLGAARDGTYAERVVVPRTALRRLPEGADLRASATVGIAGKTAWRAVHQLAQVAEGDVVLVLGASGGVGTFAAQLARATGARVIAQTGSEKKAARLDELGLETIVAGDSTLADQVEGFRVSVVLDPLGGDYLSSLLRVLAPGARAVTYGVLSGSTTNIDLATLYGKGLRIIGTSGGTTPPSDGAAAIEGALAAVNDGTVVVDVDVVALDQAPKAFERLRSRLVAGKVLLAPGADLAGGAQ